MGSFAGDGPTSPIVHGTNRRIQSLPDSRGLGRDDGEAGREASPPLRPPAAADADDDDSTRRPPSTRLRLQEHVWSPSMEMAGCNLSKVQMEVDDKSPKEHDTIKIFLEEEMKIEVEAFSGFIIGSCLRGKMAVSFPPNSDRFVQFELGKLFDLRLKSHPLIDKDLLRNLWYVKPKSPERPFRTGPDDILTWNQSVFIAPPPPMLKVTADANPDVTCPEGVTHSIVSVSYIYPGQSPLQDLVITVPFPHVDESGRPRRVVKTHSWHNVGTHVESADCIEWHLGSVNDSNPRGDFPVDYYYDGGTYDIEQFFPINASFSYTNCRALEVKRARGPEGLLDFVKSKTGHGPASFWILV